MRARLAVLSLWVVAVPACLWDEENCRGLREGDQVRVTLIEPYDRESQFKGSSAMAPLTCNGSVGFATGDTFTATLTDFGSNHFCFSGLADTFVAGGWTWTRDPEDQTPGGGEVLAGLYSGQKGACTGQLQLSVRTDKLPTTPSQPGSQPMATLSFSVRPTGTAAADEACPKSCGGVMVVSVEKVEPGR